MGKKNNKSGHTPKQKELAAARAARMKKEEAKEQLTKKQKTIATAIAVVVAVAVVALAIILIVSASNKKAKANTGTTSETAAETAAETKKVSVTPLQGTGVDAVSDSDIIHHAEINVAGYGVIYLELDETVAPVTVNQFITLAKSGFYNGLTFHRILDGFMMQGGDPEGNGFGNADNCIAGEFEANGYKNPISHTRGTISMARSNASYDTASCQFFIVQSDDHVASLDGKYAAFGHVTAGMEVVDDICAKAEPIDNNGLIATEAQPVITSIDIID